MSKSYEIAVLTCKDVIHEWRMSLCVMFAVAAIATPLLLFFGLKSGVMQTLKQRLLSNPATMELVSVTERKLDEAFFDDLKKDPMVSFVIPKTRRLAASAEFVRQGNVKNRRASLDLYPSGQGDPLLIHYKIKAPEHDECVLTAEAARRMGAQSGDKVTATVSRDRGTYKVEREFTVSGVLPEAAGTLAGAYITLEELEEIENFKDGIAVPSRSWSGQDSVAYPVTPAVLVVLDDYLDAVREVMLIQNTGFAKFSKIGPENYKDYHPALSADKKVYLISTVGNPALKNDLMVLSDRFRGRKDAIMIPFNDSLSLRIGADEFKVRALSGIDKRLYADERISDISLKEKKVERVIYLSEAYKDRFNPQSTAVTAVMAKEYDDGSSVNRELTFDCRIVFVDYIPDDTVLMSVSLMMQLSLLEKRELTDGVSSDGEKAFVLKRKGYTGFRMYAASLTDVVPLQAKMTDLGIRTVSKADRISEVLSLDRYLTLLFVLIASASLLGAVCCLMANVYANVERKRKELAILRLLGVNSCELCVFPLVGSLLLTLGGIGLSLLVFYILSYVVNSMFSYQLQGDEKFCDLNYLHALAAIGIACVLSAFSGLMASRRIMLIDPSESLRDE